jgi:hypothetical protein
MGRIVIAAAVSLFVVSLATIASADTLVMRDGSRIQGTVLGIAGRTITFQHADGVSHRYPTSRVDSLEFFSSDRDNPRAASARRLDAPAGTELVVRTVETIDSSRASTDRSFGAIVEHQISDASGRVIIPARSSATLVLRHLRSGDAAAGPQVVLDVESITVDGRRYTVGTVAGAIASDRKGAAIGLLIGTAAEGLYKGRDVNVPAETVLRFLLDRPVTLRVDG